MEAPFIKTQRARRVYTETRKSPIGFPYNVVHIGSIVYYLHGEYNNDDLGATVWVLKGPNGFIVAVIHADGCALVTDVVKSARHLKGGFIGIETGCGVAVTDSMTWAAGEAVQFLGVYDEVDTKAIGWIVLNNKGKKNAIIPHVSRHPFFKNWQDEIITMRGFAKVSNGSNGLALDKNGTVLSTDVVSVSAYPNMCFIRCKNPADNFVVDADGTIIVRKAMSFTALGDFAAIKEGNGYYGIFDSKGRKVFNCGFERVTHLGMYNHGLMYRGLWYIFDNSLKRISSRGFAKVDKYIKDFSNDTSKEGYLLVSSGGKFNFVTEAGTLLLPFWVEKAHPFTFPKTADITYGGEEYMVYDSKNWESAYGVMRTTRPGMRVCKKSRKAYGKFCSPLMASHEITYDRELKSFSCQGTALRGITSRVWSALKASPIRRSKQERKQLPVAEYGQILHSLIETIEEKGSQCYGWRKDMVGSKLEKGLAESLHAKYLELRNRFEAVFVESEYACWDLVENATSIDFVFADVDGGAILVEIKTNAEYPAEYLRAQMSIEKDFFLKTNPQIRKARTFCFWFPRGRINDAEIREVASDLSCDEMDAILRTDKTIVPYT